MNYFENMLYEEIKDEILSLESIRFSSYFTQKIILSIENCFSLVQILITSWLKHLFYIIFTKKALAIAGAFFSYIRLWRVVLLRSGIMLRIVILPAATLCE